MDVAARAGSTAKAWLSEFLFTREMFKGPDGKPLYSYHVTEAEFRSLVELLRSHFKRGSVPNSSAHPAACFCLLVSEQYRRAYNSSWSWSGSESLLEVSFSPQQHAHLTATGLAYWKRPIRLRENGRDWLGSLFSEGGLPWPLVQSESHGFGRAVRRGITHFYRTEGNRRTTADLMADFENDLPVIFRNLETRRLLAGIVDQLMYLVEHHPLRDQEDPASYLDQAAPGWTGAFPIPLDESNARTLLNDWLRDAGKKRRERQESLEKARAFTCEHFLHGTLPQWLIRTELILPQETEFAVDPTSLSSTRLELAYYEGERILARGPAVYGQLTEKGIKARFSNPQVTLERRDPSEPLSLRLLDNGRVVHQQYFDGSVLDFHDVPLIFERRSERWQLAAVSSCSLISELVRVRVPKGYTTSFEGDTAIPLGEDQESGLWMEANSCFTLQKGDDCYLVALNQADGDDSKPTLSGVFALYESTPALIFLGWPNLDVPEDYPYGREDLLEFVNGVPLDRRLMSHYGSVRYTLRTRSGKTLMHRRFGVLPRDFNLSLFPEVREQPARIHIKSAAQLGTHIVSDNLIVEQQGESLNMRHQGGIPPSTFVIEVGQVLPTLQLRLPYPYQGARLLDQDGNPSGVRELLLVDLMGYRISLTSGLTQGQTFHMQLELVSAEQPHPQRVYRFRVGTVPVMLNLFSYLADMQNMLGAVDEQDAYIRLVIESERPLLQLDIRRYGGQLEWEGRHVFHIGGVSNKVVLDGVKAEAMLLSDPKQSPLQLMEKTSESVGTGSFEIPQAMQSRGPWLVYPAGDSAIRFRPGLYLISENNVDPVVEVISLHRAAELFHPWRNPDVIDQQVAAMAGDFNHSGWQYLADLKQNYHHLPLSSFETWKSLSRNQEALSFAVFRLEMDESFCARIRDELAVIWETIPLPLWVKAHRVFQDAMCLTGLPEMLVKNLVSNRASVLRFIVSGFEYLGDYLSTGSRSSLIKVPPESVLPIWYQDLRRFHEANRSWPTLLGRELSSWVEELQLPPLVKALSLAEFTDAVTYLPIFMAYVSAGQAKITDLPAPPAYLKFAIRLISDFDRQGWFVPAHALMVSYLLASQDEA